MEDYVLKQIKKIASKYKINKVILFGSRARGDNTTISDYDIAIFSEKLTSIDKALFCSDIDEIHTLKKIDIVFVNENTKYELIQNIKNEGVKIHE